MDCVQITPNPFKPVQGSVCLCFIRSSCEAGNAVPAVGCRDDLNIAFICRSKDHAPELLLDRVVYAVLDFVDEKNAVSAIRERKGNAQKALCAITQALQWNWQRRGIESDNDAAPPRAIRPGGTADDSKTFKPVSDNRTKSASHEILGFSQCNRIPETGDIAGVEQAWPEGFMDNGVGPCFRVAPTPHSERRVSPSRPYVMTYWAD